MSDVYTVVRRIHKLAVAASEGGRQSSVEDALEDALDEYVETKIKEALISYGLLVEREYGE